MVWQQRHRSDRGARHGRTSSRRARERMPPLHRGWAHVREHYRATADHASSAMSAVETSGCRRGSGVIAMASRSSRARAPTGVHGVWQLCSARCSASRYFCQSRPSASSRSGVGEHGETAGQLDFTLRAAGASPSSRTWLRRRRPSFPRQRPAPLPPVRISTRFSPSRNPRGRGA